MIIRLTKITTFGSNQITKTAEVELPGQFVTGPELSAVEQALFEGMSPAFKIQPQRAPEPPKPREWWINLYSQVHSVHESRAAAFAHSSGLASETAIHVREVLPETVEPISNANFYI